MSMSATARDMHVHVHTVQYRLAKVEELSGLSLRDCEERLTLELSLRINDLASALPAQPPA
ncbi:MAG TPA: helix-turn-helix domain-containing protein [Streptosporangiaceae bacterium]|nr:helix-turn-helix domain-containing protein [Streptosporangiaceae bacterium]